MVCCVDVQPKMIENVRHKVAGAKWGSVRLVVGDARRLPFKRNTFDRTFLITVLGEIRGRSQALDELHHVLPHVDYFISVAPSTPDNQKMLNAEAFSRMKPSAFYINMGRGEVVDEDALIQALKEKKIAGAALDTFRQEPLPPEHPFWGMENVIITPHVGGMSDTYVQQAVEIFRQNLRRFLKGETEGLINVIPRG